MIGRSLMSHSLKEICTLVVTCTWDKCVITVYITVHNINMVHTYVISSVLFRPHLYSSHEEHLMFVDLLFFDIMH